MRIEKFNGHTIELYDSIEDMNIERYQKYNRNLLLDSGIGGDLQGISNLIGSIMRYNEIGDKENVKKQLSNLNNAYMFVLNGVSPGVRSFACLVKTIDGEENNDLSDSGIDKVIEKINKRGGTIGMINNALSEIKKKLKLNLKRSSRKREQTTKQYNTSES